MKYELFSVKDVLAGNFSKIEIMPNRDVAKRWFNGLANESKIARDLQLFSLGTYDICTGEIVSKVEFIYSATEVINENNN